MEKSEFDNLLKRYLAGETTDKETAKIEAWLDVIRAEKPGRMELSKADEDRIFKKLSANLDNMDEVSTLRPKQKDKRSGAQWTLRIAASLSFLFLVSYGIWYVLNQNQRDNLVASADVNKLILGDGSLVWLQGESKLAYYEKIDDGTRNGELTGEALFEIAKDPEHPFIIRCGDINVKVLGTSFTVKTGTDQVELKVLTGKVSLSSPMDNDGVVIESNEQVIYHASGEIVRKRLTPTDVESLTKNTAYNMEFTDASMNEVLDRIGDKFDVNIAVEDKDAGRCRITADFTDRSLDSALEMITEVLDVSYTKKGRKIIIRGNGCQ